MKKVTIITAIITFCYMVVFDIIMLAHGVALPLVFLFSAATICCNLAFLDILDPSRAVGIENGIDVILSD